MKSKKMMVSMLSMSMVLGAAALPAYASTTTQTTQKQEEIMPRDYDVSSGSEENIVELEKPYTLDKKDGKYINFWIRNTGHNDIAITINGKAERIISPGKQGHTYIEAGFFKKEYIFKAVPTPNGGRISLDYSIAQRDSQ